MSCFVTGISLANWNRSKAFCFRSAARLMGSLMNTREIIQGLYIHRKSGLTEALLYRRWASGNFRKAPRLRIKPNQFWNDSWLWNGGRFWKKNTCMRNSERHKMVETSLTWYSVEGGLKTGTEWQCFIVCSVFIWKCYWWVLMFKVRY